MKHVFVERQGAMYSFTDSRVVRVADESLRPADLRGNAAVTYVERNPIFYAGIAITGGCNLDCEYCTAGATKNAALERAMTVDQFETAIRELVDQGLAKVSLTGGEPFTHPHLREIYGVLGKYSVPSVMNTNGTLLNSSLMQWMIDNGLQEIDISVTDIHDDGAIYADGMNRAPARWRGLSSAVEEFQGRLLFRASTVLTRRVVENLFEYEEIFSDMGVDSWLQRELLFTDGNRVSGNIRPEPKMLADRMAEFATAERKMVVAGYLYEVCAGLHRRRRCHNLEKDYVFIHEDGGVSWLARLFPNRMASLATEGTREIAATLSDQYKTGVPDRCAGCGASYFCMESPEREVPL